MAPALRCLLDGETRRSREIREAAARLLELSQEQLEETLPSGSLRWVNRCSWALSYLHRAGAVERVNRGSYRVTDAGRRLLGQFPHVIGQKDLLAFHGLTGASHVFDALDRVQSGDSTPPETPEHDLPESRIDPFEQISSGVERIEADVAAQLLQRILDQDPGFFEQAVLDLLMAMGYGGAEGAARRTQMSRDGGIDGVIDQDALGLARIYVQAKRYAADNVVTRPAIQGFMGALAGNSANQGVFITTSRFSDDAKRYADTVPARIVLIDGERLVRLMIRYQVGVQVRQTVTIVEVDEDFFERAI